MRVPPDQREARDLHTGELKVRDAVPLHLLTPGHHFRCHRAKATKRYIIMGKRGIEMMDLSGNNHCRNNWVRGTCQYGIMPANGLLYVPPNSCGCYSEAALRGFSELETTVGVTRYAPLNALALLIGSQAGRGGSTVNLHATRPKGGPPG